MESGSCSYLSAQLLQITIRHPNDCVIDRCQLVDELLSRPCVFAGTLRCFWSVCGTGIIVLLSTTQVGVPTEGSVPWAIQQSPWPRRGYLHSPRVVRVLSSNPSRTHKHLRDRLCCCGSRESVGVISKQPTRLSCCVAGEEWLPHDTRALAFAVPRVLLVTPSVGQQQRS